MKTYTAQIVEVITDINNQPTLELKIRIPIKHGRGNNSLITTDELPIAKPMLIPGAVINLDAFKQRLENFTYVRVVESNEPGVEYYYTGFITDSGSTVGIGDIQADFDILDGGVF